MELADYLKELDSVNDSLITTATELIESYQYTYRFDVFCTAVLNRTLNLNRGFISEINDENFICAAPLVRMNVDTLIRFYASFLINYNIDDFAQKVIEGKTIRNLEDARGKKMTDTYLVKQLSQARSFEWVEQVYKTANGFVHLSEKHIFSSFNIDPSSSTMKHVLMKNDELIPIDEKIGAVKYMIKITDGIKLLVQKWIDQKRSYNHKEE